MAHSWFWAFHSQPRQLKKQNCPHGYQWRTSKQVSSSLEMDWGNPSCFIKYLLWAALALLQPTLLYSCVCCPSHDLGVARPAVSLSPPNPHPSIYTVSFLTKHWLCDQELLLALSARRPSVYNCQLWMSVVCQAGLTGLWILTNLSSRKGPLLYEA